MFNKKNQIDKCCISILYKILFIILFLFIIHSTVVAQWKYLKYTSTFSGGFNWGSSSWQPGTNHEKRYAETSVTFSNTQDRSQIKFLNMYLSYSQIGKSGTVKAWISTDRQLPIDVHNDPHFHHNWWNHDTRNSGSYDLGTLTVYSTGSWISHDIGNWLNANPADTYYITFYLNKGYGDDVRCNAVWLSQHEGISNWKYLKYTSTFSSGFYWGSSSWQPGTNHEKRYAETSVTFSNTQDRSQAKFLNMYLSYSQIGKSGTVKAWIHTDRQLPLDVHNDPHFHHTWWNHDTRNSGGYDLGTLTVHNTGSWISHDIGTWLAANSSDTYYITFYLNQGFGDDVRCNAVWLGPNEIPTDVKINESLIPNNYELTNYPNPFNPTTTIDYQLPRSAHVSLKIFDISGKEITTLVDNMENAGKFSVTWDGRNFSGQLVSSGIYLAILKASGFVAQNKLIFAK